MSETNKDSIEVAEDVKAIAEVLGGTEEATLIEEFERETGKNAIWHGKETKAYRNWKAELKREKIIEDSGNIVIPFNNMTIELCDDGVYQVITKYVDGELKYYKSLILDGRLELLYKTFDVLNNSIELFTFKINNTIYYTKSIMEILRILESRIYYGYKGKDIIKRIFNQMSGNLRTTKAEYILGFNDGWKLPIKENDYSLILHTDIETRVFNSCKKIIKEYSQKNREEIINKLKRFIEITKMDKLKVSIIIGFAMASPFRLAFLEYFNIFPILYLLGHRNTGKSSFNELFSVHFFRVYDKHLSPSQLNSESRTEDYLSTSTFPINIQEVNRMPPKVQAIIKEHATGSSDFERKKSATESLKKPKVASLTLDSNFKSSEFDDSALISKVLFLYFGRGEVIKRDKEWIELFRDFKKEKLFSFIYDLTKDWDNQYVFDIFDKIDDVFEDDIDYLDTYYPRLVPIYKTVIFGIQLFEEAFDNKIKLERGDIMALLMKSRRQTQETLLERFLEFMDIVLTTQDNDSMRFPKFITSKLRIDDKNERVLFTQRNLRDFNDFCVEEKYKMVQLGNLLQESLDNKDLIKPSNNKIDGKTSRHITIAMSFIKYKKKEEKEPKNIDMGFLEVDRVGKTMEAIKEFFEDNNYDLTKKENLILALNTNLNYNKKFLENCINQLIENGTLEKKGNQLSFNTIKVSEM